MKLVKNGLIPAAIMAMAVSACGGGPDLDKVKAEFDSPSGSAKDKNGVIAATGKQEAAGNSSVLTLAGGGVPGGSLSSGKVSNFSRISPQLIFANQLRSIAYQGTGKQELRAQQFSMDSSCYKISGLDEKAQAKLAGAILSGGKASVKASFSADLSSCEGNLSGSIDGKIKFNVDGPKLSYEIKYNFNAACDNDSGDCLDGAMEAEATIESMGDSVLGGEAGALKMVSAWDLTATFKNLMGADESINSKGGLRIGYLSNAMGQSATLELLEIVKDSSGNEVGYVLVIGANSMGEASLTIRCKDGEITCTYSEATGAGTCSGTVDGSMFSLEWTDAEYGEVTASDDFKG